MLSIDEVGPHRKQLKVEVPAPAVEAEINRVVDEYRRQARLPGFRKGKVPKDLIKQRYREDIEQAVVDRLIPRYWRQAEAEAELEPLLPPSVDEVDLKPGSGLTFVASVEVRPQIELGEIGDFDLPEIEIEPTDKEVEKAIEDARRAVAEWVVTQRSAAQGDLVSGELIELSTESDQEPQPQAVSFEVGDPQVWEELSLEVTGKTFGQVGEFERHEGEGEEEQTRRFRVTVETVKERELPDLDDAFASRIGDYENLNAMEEDVRQRLQRAKTVDRRQKRQRAALDQLQERHPMELPKGVVDSEIQGMLEEYAQSLASSGVDVEDNNLDWQAMAEQVRPQAEKRVHSRLLLDAVAAKLDLAVDEDEFEKTLVTIARSQNRSTPAVRQELDESGRLAGLREQMRREKALNELLGEEPATAPSTVAVDEESESKD